MSAPPTASKMNCDDVKHGIYVYLDGEYASEEEGSFRRHLEACPPCKLLAEREAGFLLAVKEGLETPGVPETFQQRISACLDSAPAPLGRERSEAWSDRIWPIVAPAVALAAGLALFLVGPMGASEPLPAEHPAAEHVVSAHTTAFPMEVRGSEDQVQQFVQDAVPFPVRMPLPERPDVELIGARLTQVGGKPGVLFRYDWGGRTVSVLQAADTSVRPASLRGVDVAHRRGFGIVTWGQRGVTNAVVADVPDRELMKLVPASWSGRQAF